MGPQGLQIVVGQSATVVRDAVERALVQECAPPLSLSPIPDNPGRLLVPLQDLKAWAAAAVGRSHVRVDPSIDFLRMMDTRRTGGGGGVSSSGDGGAARRHRWQQQLLEEEAADGYGESDSMK